MIFSFEGNQREGKNVGSTALAIYLAKLSGNSQIYANYHIFGYEPFKYFENWDQIPRNRETKTIEVLNSILVYDELGTTSDARTWKSKSQILFTHFFAQMGKMGNTFIYTAQRPFLVEKRVREQTDIVIKVHKDLISGRMFEDWYDTRSGRENAKFIGSYEIGHPELVFKHFNTLEIVKSNVKFDDIGK